jgi:nitrite reductase (NO-forming)
MGGGGHPPGSPGLVIPSELHRRPTIRRAGDRTVVAVALVLSLLYLAAAAAAIALAPPVRRGVWLPLHLAMAGAAATAIAGILPYFTTSLAGAPPAPTGWRFLAVAAVASGAAAVAGGVPSGVSPLAVAGGSVFLVGIALTGWVAFGPLRRGLGPWRGIVTAGYAVALTDVGMGVLLALLDLAGWDPVVALWPRLRLAHAWLNLVGFVGLTIAATLLHLFPTVVGTRIVRRPTAVAAVLLLAVGPPTVGLAAALLVFPLALSGAGAVVLAAVALLADLAATYRRRGRWRTELAWHHYATAMLAAAPFWFLIGTILALRGLMGAGLVPTAWSTEELWPPLLGGWVVGSLLGAAGHLVPAIGPGDQELHREQRRLLGKAATARVVTFQAGIAVLTLATAGGAAVLALPGALLAGGSSGMSLALTLIALARGVAGRGQRPTAGGGGEKAAG